MIVQELSMLPRYFNKNFSHLKASSIFLQPRIKNFPDPNILYVHSVDLKINPGNDSGSYTTSGPDDTRSM